MITTFNAMQPSVSPRFRFRSSIIAALSLAALLVLGGCSLIKLGYGQASSFAFRWLDRYADFDDAQSLRVRGGLDDWFAWHRRSQLPDYADLLARAQVEVLGDVTPERMCTWVAEVRARIPPAVERGLPVLVDVLPTLAPAQLAGMEKRYRETNDEYRDDFVDRRAERRRQKAIKRQVERAETLYGSLDDAQREFIVKSVAASPFDGELSLSERQRRQQDALALIRRLNAAPPSREETEAQIRAYLSRVERSPRDEYRSYSERLIAYNCEFASALHNRTGLAQRRAAAKKLKGYEADLRELSAGAAS